MRVAFFGQSGPYAPNALRRLLAVPSDVVDTVLVVEGRKHPVGRHKHRILPPKRGPIPQSESIVDIASAAGVTCFSTSDVNSPRAVGTIANYDIDMIVCVGFDRLFKPALLEVASVGGMNAHPSMLPELRGPAPIFWALRHRNRQLAVTIHALDAHEDHGDIYAQLPFALPAAANASEIYRIAGDIAGGLIESLLVAADAGELNGVAQEHQRATRAPRPKPEDAYFDPQQWACDDLINFVAVAPFFKSAWTRLGDEVFFVRRGLGCKIHKTLPAQYLLQGSMLMVQCKDGVAQLEVQI